MEIKKKIPLINISDLKPIKNFKKDLGILKWMDIKIPFNINTKKVSRLITNGESTFPKEFTIYLVDNLEIDGIYYDVNDLSSQGLAEPKVQEAFNSYFIEMGKDSNMRQVTVPYQAAYNTSSGGMQVNDGIFLLSGLWSLGENENQQFTFEGAFLPILAGQTYTIPNSLADCFEKEFYNRTRSLDSVLDELEQTDPEYKAWIQEKKKAIG